MKKTVSNVRKNTKNLARNTFAGGLLAGTVSSTDLLENFTTSITRPTSNILKTIENTSDAIGDTFRNTAKGNILHTAGNIVTLAPRALGSIAEGTLKTAGHGLQYVSGSYQTSANSLTTTAQDIQQTFSTSDESPDIPHKEINLKEATNLGRDGSHGILNSKEPPKSKFGRRLGNVKNSIVNIPMNIGRIGTDVISTVAKRSRGVVESIEGIPKDIKKSRSGVFTKGQSFGTKFGKVFTEGIRGSIKSLARGARNIVNEGAIKTTVATAGVGANFVGRTIGNTIIPLFSTKAGREQTDNIFEKQSWFQKIKGYYDSTPRSNITTTIETPKEDKKEEHEENTQEKKEIIKKEDEQGKEKVKETESKEKENKKEIDQKEASDKEEIKSIEKEAVAPEVLATIVTGHAAIKELKQAFENKDKAALDIAKDKILRAQATEKNINKDNLPEEHKTLFKEIKSTASDIGQLKYKIEDPNKPIDNKEANKSMAEYINQEQQRFTKLYNEQKEINKEDAEKWIKSLQGYHKAGGKIVFTGKQDKSGNVINGRLDTLTIEDDKVKVGFTSDDNKSHTDEISLDKVFDSKFSVHAPETKVIAMKTEDDDKQQKPAA